MKATKTNLMAAYHQWANRPADERFWSLEDMLAAATAQRQRAAQATVPANRLTIVPQADGDLRLAGPSGAEAKMTNWGFGQLASMAGAPAAYLRGLPAPVAACKWPRANALVNYSIEAP
jgi:hypothetical protein